MIRFGTGGWRAIIGDEFIKSNVQLLAAGLLAKMRKDGLTDENFVIGYDRRFLGIQAAEWIAEIMAAGGVKTQIINRAAPTPLVMFYVMKNNLPYGCSVTASHNPALYNGIKVFMEGGRDANEELTDEIELHIRALEARMQDGEPREEVLPIIPLMEALSTGVVEYINPMNEYIDAILDTVDELAIRKAHLKIVMDPMYGVSKTALQTILLTMRCEVDVIHDRHDTLFGGRLPAPNEKTLSGLMNFVEENACDIGIATDGDADRLGVIDDKSQFLHPNKILVLIYYYLLKYKGWRGAVVRNVATTHMLDKIAAAFDQICLEVPVGFKNISAGMEEVDAIIGGESSGGLTVKGHIKGKDGIYAATLLIEMLATTGRSLSSIWADIQDEFGVLEMGEADYRFTAQRKIEINEIIMVDKLLPDFGIEIERVSYMDGCKVFFKNGGWLICRFSGTEPLLRIFSEMPTMDEANRVIGIMADFLELR